MKCRIGAYGLFIREFRPAKETDSQACLCTGLGGIRTEHILYALASTNSDPELVPVGGNLIEFELQFLPTSTRAYHTISREPTHISPTAPVIYSHLN